MTTFDPSRSEAGGLPEERAADDPVDAAPLDVAATYARLDALVNWERRKRRSARFSLDPMRDLCLRLGAPERALAPDRVVHIAGSKGKGSVAALVARAAGAAGLRVGVYGSPHVERIEERVVIDGRPVAPPVFAAALERVMAAREDALRAATPAAAATWFDVVTAAALCVFADAALDLWVLECGLGGRLDSTNAVAAGVCVITSIELEHTEVLGATRARIAGEKAGILKPPTEGTAAEARPGPSLVCGVPRADAQGAPDEAWVVIEARARAVGAAVAALEQSASEAAWERLTIDERNQRLAGAVLDALGRRGITGADGAPLAAGRLTERAIAAARLPGRLERLAWVEHGSAGQAPGSSAQAAGEQRAVPVVIDGAHTPRSVSLALASLDRDRERGAGPGRGLVVLPVVVLALGHDKDLAGILKALVGRADQLLCTSMGAELFRPPDQIVAAAAELGLAAETASAPRTALRIAVDRASGGGWVLVLGSLYLAGAVRRLLVPPV